MRKITKKKSQEEFESQVTEMYGDEYKFLEPYKGTNIKILCKHSCGHEYSITPKRFLKGSKCSKCSIIEKSTKRRKTTKDFKEEVFNVHGNDYIVLGEYTTCKSKIEVRHNNCGNTYLVRPDSFLRGATCKKCLHDKYKSEYRKTTEEFKDEVDKLTNGDYELVSEYSGVNDKVKIKHISCGNKYEVFPYLFLRGRRCPQCNESTGESLVRQVLNELNIRYEEQVLLSNLGSETDGRKSYDFYIPESKLLIEYQGIQHYKPVDLFGGKNQYQQQLKSDNIKRSFASNNGYILLEIPYTENTYDKIKNIIEIELFKIRKAENP